MEEKMKILLKICSTIIILWAIAFAQAPDTVWRTTIDLDLFDQCYAAQQTNDGGYILVGSTYYWEPGMPILNDIVLIKVNSTGHVLWYEIYGGSGDDEGFSVQQTSEGGYIIVGKTDSFGAGSYDLYLIKTTPEAMETNDDLSLAYNSNRHLVRKPNSTEFHVVYTACDRICYCKSSDDGGTWSDVTNLGKGKYPAIALGSDYLPLLTWTDDVGGLWYGKQNASGQWTIAHLYDPGILDPIVNSPPSIAAYRGVWPTMDTVHILVTIRSLLESGRESQHWVRDYKFELNNPQSSFIVVEEATGPAVPPCRGYPSITADDWGTFHAVWMRQDTVCYAVRQPRRPWNVWGWRFGTEGLQSAHPYVETYGDSIFVTWQHLESTTQKEDAYRGARHRNYDFHWDNFSQTSDLISVYPVNAWGFFTAYAEETQSGSPYDIC